MDGLEQGLRIANLGLWFRGFCANLFQFRDTHLANVHIPIQEILLPVPLVLYNRWRRAAGLSSISQEFNLYTHRRGYAPGSRLPKRNDSDAEEEEREEEKEQQQ